MTMDDDNVLGTSDDGHATMQLEEVSIWRDIGRSTAHGCNEESAGAGESVYNLHSAGIRPGVLAAGLRSFDTDSILCISPTELERS